MVLNCVAINCSNEHNKNSDIQFHRFPFRRPEICELWVKAIRRDKWYPALTSRLCSQHFSEKDYFIKPGGVRKSLKPDAVTSVFDFPKYLQKPKKFRRILKRVTEVESVTELQEEQEHESMLMEKEVPKLISVGCQTVENFAYKENMMRRKIRSLQQKVTRKSKKITTLQTLIAELKRSGSSTDNLTAALSSYFTGFSLDFLIHNWKNEKCTPRKRQYSELMKKFASTLYFYSPKAYQFVKQHFILPNGRTIRNWLSKVNCQPGFLQEVFDFLKNEVRSNGSLQNCALIFDAISIRKQIVWENCVGKYVGYVDYGGLVADDFDNLASEALFFQIVSYTCKLKFPVAYFLINKVDSGIQSQMILACLRKLFEIGIVIRSLTCDGTVTNIATFKNLGADIAAYDAASHFQHPCSPNTRVHVFLDTCHMIKLARNCMAEAEIKSNSGVILWRHIQNLHSLQTAEHLRFANSLSASHIRYKNKIMNVKLAAQTLSCGVADSLEFLCKSGQSEFKNCDATVEFIRTIDRVFDILNSRNPFGKGFKAPIRPQTLAYFKEIFSASSDYFNSLMVNNVPILRHQRKTFALGFIINMNSTLNLAMDLFSLEESPLQYFLAYKVSQDHLELFFSCIRSRGGWNNNPNSLQLRWALRQVLFKNSVSSSVSANCVNYDESNITPAFEFRSSRRCLIDSSEDVSIPDLNYTTYALSEFQDNILYYICGYIVKKLIQKSTCACCVEILTHNNGDANLKTMYGDHLYSASDEKHKKFYNFVNRGGLFKSSNVVFKVVQACEKFILAATETGILFNKKFALLLQNAVVQKFSASLHLFEPPHPPIEELIFEDLHEMQIVKAVCKLFLQCRMPHLAKLINESAYGSNIGIRQKLHKLILFHNQ